MGSAILGFLWRFRLPIVVVLCLSAAYYKGRGDEDAKWRAAASKAEVEWTQKVSDAEKQAYKDGALDALLDERNKDVVDEIKKHASKEPGAAGECLSADTVERLRSIQ